MIQTDLSCYASREGSLLLLQPNALSKVTISQSECCREWDLSGTLAPAAFVLDAQCTRMRGMTHVSACASRSNLAGLTSVQQVQLMLRRPATEAAAVTSGLLTSVT